MQFVSVPELQSVYRSGTKVVIAGNLCKADKLTRIPFSDAFSTFRMKRGDINHIEAVACWANKRAITAAEAAIAQIVPDFVVPFKVDYGGQVFRIESGLEGV